jgi:hypothetical protein
MRFPIESYLVPAEPSPLPETMTALAEPLAAGLPQTIQLDRDVSLVVVVPSGLAVTWRDAASADPVSSAADELAPAQRDPAAPVGAVDRAAPRLFVLLRGTLVASAPLVAGSRRSLPDDGGAQGQLVELAILGWDIRAGTLRSPGAFGSRLELAWRRSDGAAASFEPPAINPQLRRRLDRASRLESDLAPVEPAAGSAQLRRQVR